jgi:hypothetical protein
MSAQSKEPARLQAEELRIKREIVDVTVSNFHVFKAAFETNETVVQRFSLAAQTTPKLVAALEQLQKQSQSLAAVGQAWRTDKQIATAAVAQHQKLLELLEAPQTIDVCVRSEMYHEALLALEHIHSFANGFGAAAPPLVTKLLRDVNSTLHKLLNTVVIPRLATNISLSLAIKLTTFLRRLGVGEQHLRQLFLTKRSELIDNATSDAEAPSTAPYSCLSRLLTAMKVHGSEVVTQFHACFTSLPRETGQQAAVMCDELAQWTASRSASLVQHFEKKLPHVTSGAEIASLLEQSHNAASVLAKVGLDVTPAIVDMLAERIVSIFTSQISGAEQSYTAAMNAHTWKTQQVAGAGRQAEGPAASGSSGSIAPPVALLPILPLSYAMNGILTACNEVRKCAAPVAAGRCVREVTRFVLRIADDIASSHAMLQLLDEGEQKGVAAFADAFVYDFVPHVAKCIERLFSSMPQLGRHLPAEVLARTPFAVRPTPAGSPAGLS